MYLYIYLYLSRVNPNPTSTFCLTGRSLGDHLVGVIGVIAEPESFSFLFTIISTNSARSPMSYFEPLFPFHTSVLFTCRSLGDLHLVGVRVRVIVCMCIYKYIYTYIYISISIVNSNPNPT